MAGPSLLPLRLAGVKFGIDGKALLTDIDLEIEARGRTVVLGPNGAGKSLLLRLCHGLIEPSAGTVRWAAPAANGAARHAMVFQRPVMLRRSARANIDYALGLNGVHGARARARRDRALADTGLAHLAERAARVLSVGEQQRLALARAWALDPAVLFLDEPTASLDPSAARQVEDIIRAIDAGGAKIVMTTHDLGQARRLADEIVFLHRGRLLERGPAARFFERPSTAEAGAFIKGELIW
jgi:tungstate transport system ATP-binding protein